MVAIAKGGRYAGFRGSSIAGFKRATGFGGDSFIHRFAQIYTD